MTHPAVSGETAAAQKHDPQPGALDAAGLRRVVTVLSTVQIVSWGVLYYAFAALQSSITTDTGWSGVAVTGAFSLAQLCSGGAGIWVGRHIDAYGPRRVMTAASLVAIPGIAAVALAPNLAVFYLGWMLTGVAMAGTLYPPAFAALTRWGGTPARPGADHADVGRRAGQHRLRAARVRPRRRVRLASGLPGAADRPRCRHGAAALVGPGPAMARRPRRRPPEASIASTREHARAVSPGAPRSCCSPWPTRSRAWPSSQSSSTWCRCSSSKA